MKNDWQTFPTQKTGETNRHFLFRIYDWVREHKAELREKVATKIAEYLAENANYCYSQGHSGTCHCNDLEDLASEVQKAINKEILGEI